MKIISKLVLSQIGEEYYERIQGKPTPKFRE
jgi:hypothetical protein